MTATLATFARVFAINGSTGARVARECAPHSVLNHLEPFAARFAARYPAHRRGMPASAAKPKVGYGR